MNTEKAIEQLRKRVDKIYQTLYASERRRLAAKELRNRREIDLLKQWAERMQMSAAQLRSLGRIIAAHKAGLIIPQLDHRQYAQLQVLLKRKFFRSSPSQNVHNLATKT